MYCPLLSKLFIRFTMSTVIRLVLFHVSVYLLYISYYILPHVLRDVSNIDTATTLLGEKVTMPIGVAPTARHHNAHTDAEIPAAKGIMIIMIII